MGIGKSITVTVNLDRPNGFYYAGEQVTGTISLHIAQKKVLLTNLYVEFIGEYGYTTEQLRQLPDAFGHIEINRHTIYHRFPFVNISCPLIQSQENENKVRLGRGHHSWPFEFTLPKVLPSSLHSSTTSYPHIEYYLNIAFKDQNHQLTKKQCQTLKIFPRVNLTKVREIRASSTGPMSLQLDAYLPHQGILPNQDIYADIHLINPKGLKVQSIEANLVQHKMIAHQYQNDIIFKKNLPSTHADNQKDLHKTFQIRIPPGCLSPTHSCVIQSNDLSPTSTEVYYELELVAQIHNLSHDVKLRIPMVIGTESSTEEDTSENIDNMNIPISYAAALKEGELLPDYESAIKNLNLQQSVY